MLKQGTSEYERIQASVSLQAAACCASGETELREMHRREADAHMAEYRRLLEVERIREESQRVADELAPLVLGGDLESLKCIIAIAFNRGRAQEVLERTRGRLS